MKTFLKLCALALVVAFPQFAPGATTLKVGMVEWVAYSPLNVAEHQRFWGDLDVSVIVFGSNTELNAALTNGRIDVALDMLGSWVGLQQTGTPLVLLGETDWSNGGDKVILGKGISPADLAGKPIGIYLDQPSVTFFLNEFLTANGLTISQVKPIEMEPEALSDNFIGGRFPLIINYDPQAMRAERAGGKVAATSATFPGCIPEGFVALQSTVDRVPAADWVTFFRGWYRGVKWSADAANWSAYKTILCEKTFRGASYSDADLRAMLQSVKVFLPAEAAARNAPGGEAEGYLTRLQSFLKEQGALKQPYSPADLLRSQMMVEAARSEI